MADEWRAAVESQDAEKLAEFIISATPSREAASSLVRNCLELMLSQTSQQEDPNPSKPAAAAETASKGDAESSTTAGTPALCTLGSVQLLQPRGRFDLEFHNHGVTVAGKAGIAKILWDNLRYIMRLPRPEGAHGGKLAPNALVGSDLLALVFKESVPFRKSKIYLALLQPDPKAKHSEFSVEWGGVCHEVSGSQGAVISELLRLLSTVEERFPNRRLFLTADSKSFVKCYHGVSEGSLFPLKEGLLFMKPALFLPSADIAKVVCGRGGSAMTRYVDLVVTMEGSSASDDGEEGKTHEFSNISRECLPQLQHYIQHALVAPREREAKWAAAAAAVPVQRETVGGGNVGEDRAATPAPAANCAAVPVQRETVAEANGTTTAALSDAKGSNSRELRARNAGVASKPQTAAGSGTASSRQQQYEDESDDGDHESDEDYAPVVKGGDSDSSSSDSDSDSDSDNHSSRSGADNDVNSDVDDDVNSDVDNDVHSDVDNDVNSDVDNDVSDDVSKRENGRDNNDGSGDETDSLGRGSGKVKGSNGGAECPRASKRQRIGDAV